MTTVEELIEGLEVKLAYVVADQAAWLAGKFRSKTPANLTRTRSGIYYQTTALTAYVGIRFAVRYAGQTQTGQRFERQWNELRPQVRQRIINDINDLLKG